MDSPTAPAEPAAATADENGVPRYSYYALAVLTLVNFLNYIDRQVLPALIPTLTKELHLTHTELGIIEAVLLLSFTILAPLFGKLGDKYSRTKLMAAAAVIWSIATAVTGFADKFPLMPGGINLRLPLVNFTIALSGLAVLMCIVRTIVGVGESSFSTITPSLIADYFRPEKRGTALGIFQAAIPMGFALGYVVAGLLAFYFGWRLAFMFVGLPGLITAVFVWRLKEPIRGASDPPELNSKVEETKVRERSWFALAWQIINTRDWLLSTAGYTALTFALGAFATWGTSMLVEDKKLGDTKAAIILGIVTLAGGATGTFGGGWIADRVAKRRVNVYFLVCAIGSLLGVIPAVTVLGSNNIYVYLPAIFLAVMFLFTNNAPFHAILVGSVSPLVRATAVALNIVVIHLLGDVISRFCVGFLRDSLEKGGSGPLATVAHMVGIASTERPMSGALLVAPVALIISAFFFFWGARKSRIDGASPVVR